MKAKHPSLRVAAIHDLSGLGRTSLSAVIPILTQQGLEVCPLPTAVLSTHTQYPGFQMVDLTANMRSFIQHWEELGLSFAGIYSGFLGSAEQVRIVLDMVETFRTEDLLVVVDPVLGDNGVLYTSMDRTMIDEMQQLIQVADVITPNLTEAALLLDRPYPESLDIAELKEWSRALADKGPAKVIISGVPERGKVNQTTVVAYNSRDDRYWKVSCHYLPTHYPGTGDSFTSVIVGALLTGDSLPIALDTAVQFVSAGVRATFGHEYDTREGILLERVLPLLTAPALPGSYELLG